MKIIILLAVILFIGCNSKNPNVDNLKSEQIKSHLDSNTEMQTTKTIDEPANPKIYSNKRFREVRVERVGESKFRIQGQAQIFEANFNWIVEDGHEELLKSYQMTDAGAPEWGNFDFTIEAKKKRNNSTLTLILFESSAMDGSRQHELPIVLY